MIFCLLKPLIVSSNISGLLYDYVHICEQSLEQALQSPTEMNTKDLTWILKTELKKYAAPVNFMAGMKIKHKKEIIFKKEKNNIYTKCMWHAYTY